MKLSKLYTNKSSLFNPIEFNDGLNVVLAEIHLPENKQKNSHNLGKSSLGTIIDFCLLSKRDPNLFLFKHEDVFKEFVFFLEVELASNSFLTIRRSVELASKISFMKHDLKFQDFSSVDISDWSHAEVPFDKSKTLLDGFLNLQSVAPYDFRKGIGFHLRSQIDYEDLFELRKYRGKHVDWKPYVAQILGFDGELVKNQYLHESSLKEKRKEIARKKAELGDVADGLSRIEGLIQIKQNELEQKQRVLDSFDFASQDQSKITQLVDGLDEEIAYLNQKLYSLELNNKRVQQSLQSTIISFDPEGARKLFDEAGVVFGGQIKKDFEQLIKFNRAISDERQAYLIKEREQIEQESQGLRSELSRLNSERSQNLKFIGSEDIFEKYKVATGDITAIRLDLSILERQRLLINELHTMQSEEKALQEICDFQTASLLSNINTQNSEKGSLFNNIRSYFTDIAQRVLGRNALISVDVNGEEHIYFKEELLNDSGGFTSGNRGHSYKKLLCVAYDLALQKAHLNDKYPHFVFHDGVFESLDDKLKENLLNVFREYTEMGVQSIITLIDSDLPKSKFSDEEIILMLHDADQGGRIFKMNSF
ncbi:DUF2326 domain-containing protein [Hydromonas duriensis]|uniref:Uncharacterized protein YydD (DUF2326 family) n=1 Tax=Hydromonas duriensis TaxID=1527608 RepID=A0A4R6Y1R7_9BURK|nr:DUF2326 domain-containing protein [Hydromonas duriensis]TDR30349.1 uncharacterized protein YydD (DUF2326 family) [Hydromonas duriensis]